VKERQYEKEQRYYFVDYTLFQGGHPEYVEQMKKSGELPEGQEGGVPRWVRMDFMTDYELIQHLTQILTSPYPDRVTNLRVHTDEELTNEVTVENDGSKLLREGDEGFEVGDKMSLRQYKFGKFYDEYSNSMKSGEYPVRVYY